MTHSPQDDSLITIRARREHIKTELAALENEDADLAIAERTLLRLAPQVEANNRASHDGEALGETK